VSRVDPLRECILACAWCAALAACLPDSALVAFDAGGVPVLPVVEPALFELVWAPAIDAAPKSSATARA